MFSNGPSRSSRPLATQLSATPPASTRFFISRLPLHLPRHAQHDLLGHLLDARREVHVPLFEHGLRAARRPAKQLVEPVVGHRQPLAVVEILHVHPEAAVRLQVDQVLEDQVLIDGLSVRGQAHQLVFAAVDLETAVVGERRIEQPQRMRELQLPQQPQLVAFADAERRRAPLAHAVNGQDGGPLEGAGKESAGGMAFVVVGEDQPRVPGASWNRWRSVRRMWSLSLSHSGIASRKLLKPAARRPGRSPAAGRTW